MPATGGVARSGVACVGDARQVDWSSYAPRCVNEFEGDNGGSTAPGVTTDTISVTVRVGRSAGASMLEGLAGDAGSALGGDQDQMLADLRSYVDLFNRTYELYGRQVVLTPFDGSGDFLQESANQGASGAQVDAARVKDIGAFADISTITQTQLYAEALASQQIVSFGVSAMSQSWFDDHAPYAYSAFPTGDRLGELMANTACERMAGLPATFGGPSVQDVERVFGIISIENPEYARTGDVIERKLESCDEPVAARVTYALDPTTAMSQANSTLAQMQTAGVTTVLCLCEFFAPIFMTQAADLQGFEPEWFSLRWPDPIVRLYQPTDQWSHALSVGGAAPPLDRTEAFRAYQLADPAGPPAGDLGFPIAYQQVLQLFAALQAAGPNLTPETMNAGWSSLPESLPGGDMGPWTYGDGVFTPQSAFRLGWWSPTAVSNLDGQPGAWQDCAPDRWYPFDDPAALAPSHTQPGCFDR